MRNPRTAYVHQLYFNKNCVSGKLINEKLLPNVVEASTRTRMFTKCIGHLLSSNYDPTKFGKILDHCIGDHTTILVKNRKQLNELLKTIRIAFGTCRNFIDEKEVPANCPYCECNIENDNGYDVDAKLVIIIIKTQIHTFLLI